VIVIITETLFRVFSFLRTAVRIELRNLSTDLAGTNNWITYGNLNSHVVPCSEFDPVIAPRNPLDPRKHRSRSTCRNAFCFKCTFISKYCLTKSWGIVHCCTRLGNHWEVTAQGCRLEDQSSTWRMPSSGMWRCVDLVWTDVSEEAFLLDLYRPYLPLSSPLISHVAHSPSLPPFPYIAGCFRLVAQSAATCSHWLLARGFFYPEDEGDKFIRNVGWHKIYTAPHPRRRHSS
jgi:hypothetical protein